MEKKIFYTQITLVLLLVGLLVVTTPILISHFPSDTDRLCNINRWTSDTTIKADWVFFGSSIAMNSVAGDTISALYNVDVLSYTSVNQTLPEAFLFYTKIPKGTKVVFQCLRAIDLSSQPYIDEYKVNRLIADGYKMEDATKYMIDTTSSQLFDKSFLEACFDARGYVKSFLHSEMREILDHPHRRKEAATDMQNAYLYEYERASEAQFKKLLPYIPNEQLTHLELNREKVNMINRAYRYFDSKGIQYCLVLMPVSSISVRALPLDYQAVLTNSDIQCPMIDCSFILDDSCFADPLHPNRKGASIFSHDIQYW